MENGDEEEHHSFRLTVEEKVEIVLAYGNLTSYNAVATEFNQRHTNRSPICHKTVMYVLKKFIKVGSVGNLDRKKKSMPLTPDAVDKVTGAIDENPVTSVRKISFKTGISKSSVHRVLRASKLKPYKLRIVQDLGGDDDEYNRKSFCEWFKSNCCDPDKIIFSDESCFEMEGIPNKQGVRFWHPVNPHAMVAVNHQNRAKVTVWAAIWGNKLIGPFFFDGTVNGTKYLELLQDYVVPLIEQLSDGNDDFYFQHDGAPPHYSIEVRSYLDQVFPGRWIGRGGPVRWPPRSPDLTPLDFFLWGYLKDKINCQSFSSLEDLKSKIGEEMSKIGPETLENVQASFMTRVEACISAEGRQFEHTLH